MNNLDMKGRGAIVTGGASGIGLATARRLAQSGAGVAIWDLNEKAMAEVAASLAGTRVHTCRVDVSRPADVEAAFKSTVAALGKVDALVNSAGIAGRNARLWEYPVDEWLRVHDVNLHGTFHTCRTVVPHMIENKYGRIVNISSVMGILGRATVAGYVAAKHGLIGLTKNLAAEFGPHVTANAIAPGYIRTELNVPLQQDRAFNAMLEQRTAAHRWGTPTDLRGPLLLLASDAGAYMTGHTLVVDGGLTTILA